MAKARVSFSRVTSNDGEFMRLTVVEENLDDYVEINMSLEDFALLITGRIFVGYEVNINGK